MKKITKPMKLKAVKYKHRDNDHDLTAIQLVFSNGYKTPMFECSSAASDSNLEIKTIKIDETKDISAIAMKIEDNTVIRGLKLISDDQEMLCDEMWCTYRPKDGTWKTKTLKNNEQIIGLEVNTQENDNAIQLRWILGAATDKAADEAKNYVTTGSWRPKLLKPALFGMPQYVPNARSLKDVRELHRFNAPPKIK